MESISKVFMQISDEQNKTAKPNLISFKCFPLIISHLFYQSKQKLLISLFLVFLVNNKISCYYIGSVTEFIERNGSLDVDMFIGNLLLTC